MMTIDKMLEQEKCEFAPFLTDFYKGVLDGVNLRDKWFINAVYMKVYKMTAEEIVEISPLLARCIMQDESDILSFDSEEEAEDVLWAMKSAVDDVKFERKLKRKQKN